MLHNQSCDGIVVHRRHLPVTHEFTYAVWMLMLDIDQLDGRKLFSPIPVAAGGRKLLTRADIQQQLARNNCEAACDRIFVLNQAKSIGPSFNPVSFYFCFDRSEKLTAILADINNTPWNEKFCYVLQPADDSGQYEFNVPKRFHVSPFLPMNGHYRWRFSIDAQQIRITMAFIENEKESFFAGLYLSTRTLTRARVLKGFVRHPMQNAGTLARIYWQAAILYLKRTPFFSHPSGAD